MPIGHFCGEGERDGPGSGANVDEGRRFAPELVELAEGHLDHLLGLGPRDEHPGVDQEIERTKRPVAEDVLQRFPGAAACLQRADDSDVIGCNDLTRTSCRGAENLFDDETRLVAQAQRDGELRGQLAPRHKASSSSPAS